MSKDEEIIEELRPLLHIQVKEEQFRLVKVENFSSWKRMQNTVVCVLRAIKIMKKIKITKNATAEEYQKADCLLIKQAQMMAYENEIKLLTANPTNQMMKNSVLKNLSPYIDEYGVLKMAGRIDNAKFANVWTRRPIILPPRNLITELIVQSYHIKFLHANNETVVNELRARYVIPTIRAVVRRVPAKCQQGALSIARLSPYEPPFTHTGVDFFGPLTVTIGRRHEKRWVALFTCLTIRAVHLEIASDLSSDAFLRCLKRFMSRRRVPSFMYSDNGTNFVGASK